MSASLKFSEAHVFALYRYSCRSVAVREIRAGSAEVSGCDLKRYAQLNLEEGNP